MSNRALLVLCLLLGAVLSALFGPDQSWDLRNYHYYNPFAWNEGRLTWDIAPAQLQSYHSPIPELPFYFLVTHAPAWVVCAVLGLPWGFTAYFAIRIARLLFPPDDRFHVWAAVLFGLSGTALVIQIGLTSNETYVAALVTAAVWFAIQPRRPMASAAVAGLLMGAAVGLKLTAATFAVALALALPVLQGWRVLPVYAATAAGGFLIFAGPWLLTLYGHAGNPVFPYLNQLFRSPLWYPQPLHPHPFLNSWQEQVLFPFYMLGASTVANEAPVSDPRLALAFVLLAGYPFWRWRRGVGQADARLDFLVLYAAVAYLLWLFGHGIFRYLAALMPIVGLLGVRLLRDYLGRVPYAPLIITALVGAALGTTQYGGMVLRKAYADAMPVSGLPNRVQDLLVGIRTARPYLEVHAPQLPEHSVVLMTNGEPLSYTIPFFRRDARFLAVYSNLVVFARDTSVYHGLHCGMLRLIGRGPEHLFTLTLKDDNPWPVLARLGEFAPGDCQDFDHGLSGPPARLCSVRLLQPRTLPEDCRGLPDPWGAK